MSPGRGMTSAYGWGGLANPGRTTGSPVASVGSTSCWTNGDLVSRLTPNLRSSTGRFQHSLHGRGLKGWSRNRVTSAGSGTSCASHYCNDSETDESQIERSAPGLDGLWL